MKATGVLLLFAVSAVVLAGCKWDWSTTKTSRSQQAIAQEGASTPGLTESQVLQTADRFAGDHVRDFDLDHYPDRRCEYDEAQKSWSVFYHRVPNRWPGDHFMVKVDDQTEQSKFIRGR